MNKIRLFFALLFFMAAPAFANVPASPLWKNWTCDGAGVAVSSSLQSYGNACMSTVTPFGSPASQAIKFTIDSQSATYGTGTFTNSTGNINNDYAFFTVSGCPDNSTASGGSCACKPTFSEDSTHTSCVAAVQPCTQGLYATAEVGIGMFANSPDGTSNAVAIYAKQMTSICVNSSTPGVFCSATGSASSFLIKPVSNGTPYADVTEVFSGSLTGDTCSGPATPATLAGTPPPCAGQTGTVNGLTVCMPTESAADKQARIASAAAAAAINAKAAAITAGKTTAEADAAASAAGKAAAVAASGGSSSLASAAAGAAAGAASVTTGATAASTAAAGAGAAADASAKAASTAAGLSSAAGSAAGTAAGLAAAAASSAAKAAGATDAAAAKAGAAAGAAAAGVSAGGGTDAAAAKAGSDAGTAAAAAAAADAVPAKNPISEYCTLNPTAAICKTSVDSKFSGTCADAVPACTGDAVQCATAAASFKSACALSKAFEADTNTDSVFAKASDGRDGINTDLMKTAAHSNSVAIDNFDMSGKGWSRSCPADPSINISWGTVSTWTLPLSRVCSPLEILARAAVGITLLGALVWVIGGSKT